MSVGARRLGGTPDVGPALEGVLPGGGGERPSGRRGGAGPADAGLEREAGARRGAGSGPPVGAVRSAVPGPAFLPPPLLGVTGGSCGAGAPRSPSVRPAPQGHGLRFSFFQPRGGGTAPGDSYSYGESHSQPQVYGEVGGAGG